MTRTKVTNSAEPTNFTPPSFANLGKSNLKKSFKTLFRRHSYEKIAEFFEYLIIFLPFSGGGKWIHDAVLELTSMHQLMRKIQSEDRASKNIQHIIDEIQGKISGFLILHCLNVNEFRRSQPYTGYEISPDEGDLIFEIRKAFFHLAAIQNSGEINLPGSE